MSTRPAPWSEIEDTLIVTDYLAMLQEVTRGKKVNKSATRIALLKHLNNRTEGSVEMKRMNVSAAMVDLGLPYLPGYRPASNYQAKLKDIVLKFWPAYFSTDSVGTHTPIK